MVSSISHIQSEPWILVHINEEVCIAKFKKEGAKITSFLKTPDDDFYQSTITKEHLIEALNSDISNYRIDEMYNLFTKEVNSVRFTINKSKMITSIQKSKSLPIEFETFIRKLENTELVDCLSSCNRFLTRNFIISSYFQSYIGHLTSEKDRAIEFLGNTAKDYGANSVILKWAPENSPNYRALMKYNPESVLHECIPNNDLNTDLINLEEVNTNTQKTVNIKVESFQRNKTDSLVKKDDSKPWNSDFGDGDFDQDSLLEKFDLDNGFKLQSLKDKLIDEEESVTDIEYESPKKRKKE